MVDNSSLSLLLVPVLVLLLLKLEIILPLLFDGMTSPNPSEVSVLVSLDQKVSFLLRLLHYYLMSGSRLLY